MVCSSEYGVEESLKLLRAHGWGRNIDTAKFNSEESDIDPRYSFFGWGFNVRPTELQAGFGICQLEKLPAFNARREELAKKFFGFVKDTLFLYAPIVSAKAKPSWFALPVMVDSGAPFTRKHLMNYLEAKGIETRPIVAGNLARHPVSELFSEFRESRFVGADEIHKRGFYLGLSPMITDDDMDRLINTLGDYLQQF
jgi:CDP-6-deoxy-D-xylo-4-hexulose-3-dehydrase